MGHLDGHEENGEPENLIWTCRACNTRLGVVFKRLGLGRRTRQYNPEARGAARMPLRRPRPRTISIRCLSMWKPALARCITASAIRGKRCGAWVEQVDYLRLVGNPATPLANLK